MKQPVFPRIIITALAAVAALSPVSHAAGIAPAPAPAPTGAGAGSAGLSRSPFAVPRKYVSALQSLSLLGVVRTSRYSGAIVQVGDAEQPAIFREGVRFKLDMDDQRYEFLVAEIKEKSVVLKGKDEKKYEVSIR